MNKKELMKFCNDYFAYSDGELYWVKSPAASVKTGSMAGFVVSRGRKQVSIKGRHYYVHKIIYWLHHGYTSFDIDHINGDPSDNRIDNLRKATHSQNMLNRKVGKNSSTGVKGVTNCNDKFRVRLTVGGKLRSFGLYEDLELAELVASEVISKHHGEFGRCGLGNRKGVE